jgi:N-acetylmuramoyl-L-alanine amidase
LAVVAQARLYHQIAFVNNAQPHRTKMKLAFLLALLLALPTCAPASQVSKKSPKSTAPQPKTVEAGDRTIVCIDPGHPSEVASGKNVQNGTSETHIDWAVAAKLRAALEARGYEVVMTKSDEDELVRNKDRALVANRARAALMIRLHCDASEERGYAIYYPDRQGRAKDGTTGPSQQVIEASRRAAEAIHEGMTAGLSGALNDNGVRTDNQTKIGHEQGGALTGSIFSDVPVVTIEMVVLSQASDADFIKTDAGQQRMADAIADGVARFVGPAKSGSPGKNE